VIRNKVYTPEKPKDSVRVFVPAIPLHVRTVECNVLRSKDARLADEEIASVINTAPVKKLKLDSRMGGAVVLLQLRGVTVIVDVWELRQVLDNCSRTIGDPKGKRQT